MFERLKEAYCFSYKRLGCIRLEHDCVEITGTVKDAKHVEFRICHLKIRAVVAVDVQTQARTDPAT